VLYGNTIGVPNDYQGTPSAKAADGSYEFDTLPAAPVALSSPPQTRWVPICSEHCAGSDTKTITDEQTKNSQLTDDQKHSLTAGFDARHQGAVASGGVHASTTNEWNTVKTMGESYAHGETNTSFSDHTYTPEQMREFNIVALWQFVATTVLPDGPQIMVRSNRFACTADENPPDYFPGNPKGLHSCSGGLVNAAITNPATAAPAGAPPDQSASVGPKKIVLGYENLGPVTRMEFFNAPSSSQSPDLLWDAAPRSAYRPPAAVQAVAELAVAGGGGGYQFMVNGVVVSTPASASFTSAQSIANCMPTASTSPVPASNAVTTDGHFETHDSTDRAARMSAGATQGAAHDDAAAARVVAAIRRSLRLCGARRATAATGPGPAAATRP
jgi:hypothetical protein